MVECNSTIAILFHGGSKDTKVSNILQASAEKLEKETTNLVGTQLKNLGDIGIRHPHLELGHHHEECIHGVNL